MIKIQIIVQVILISITRGTIIVATLSKNFEKISFVQCKSHNYIYIFLKTYFLYLSQNKDKYNNLKK